MLANLFRPAGILRASARAHPAATIARASSTFGNDFLDSRKSAELVDEKGASKSFMDDVISTLDEAGDAQALNASPDLNAGVLTREDHVRALSSNLGALVAPYQWSNQWATASQLKGRKSRKPNSPTGPEARYNDVFRQLGINPVRECKNSPLMSYFTTDMGKARPRTETKLSWRSQRLVGRALRRAKMMGVLPILSKGRRETDLGRARKPRTREEWQLHF